MEEEIIQEEQTENSNSKPSYIWGIAGLAAFVILGGIGYCSWYIWIVVALLALVTLSGLYKGFQITCAIILVLFGTPVLFGDNEVSDSKSSSQAISESQNSKSGPSWLDGTWGYNGYSGGVYFDVVATINRDERSILIVSNVNGIEKDTYSVSGTTLRMSDGSGMGITMTINESAHTIDLGGGIILRKK